MSPTTVTDPPVPQSPSERFQAGDSILVIRGPIQGIYITLTQDLIDRWYPPAPPAPPAAS